MSALPLPSLQSTAYFLLLLVFVLVCICWAHSHSARGNTTRRVHNVVLFCTAWLAISASYILVKNVESWEVMLVFVPFIGLILMTIAVAFSNYGKRIAFGVPIFLLVGFHFFRLPLELLLFNWWEVGFVPIQITYIGDNLDIVTGILAIPTATLIWRYKSLRWPAWAFNIIGITLLFRIFVIIGLSNPTPLASRFGGYSVGQELLILEYFPYVWLPTIILPAALFTHIVLFRRLSGR